MRQLTTTDHWLEQDGPRDTWHPVNRDDCPEAFMLAYYGHTAEAVLTAETEYIAKHGQMHGVRFRVVTRSETITFNGPIEEYM